MSPKNSHVPSPLHLGTLGVSGWLQVSFRREETNLHPFAERCGDAPQHRQRMPFIIGIFQATDHRGSGPHEFRQLPLREAGFRAKVVDLLGKLGIGEFLLISGYLLGVLADVALIAQFIAVCRSVKT